VKSLERAWRAGDCNMTPAASPLLLLLLVQLICRADGRNVTLNECGASDSCLRCTFDLACSVCVCVCEVTDYGGQPASVCSVHSVIVTTAGQRETSLNTATNVPCRLSITFGRRSNVLILFSTAPRATAGDERMDSLKLRNRDGEREREREREKESRSRGLQGASSTQDS